ncbi:MAG: Dph6-related ATP pyrophosphatase [Candidatus Methanospirareceae archaeon]
MKNNGMKVFASWSGGKESCLACYRAISAGLDVAYLLNFVDEEGKRSKSHGVPSYLLALQAEAIGIPILHVRTTWGRYEEDMKVAVKELKRDGVEGGVFGDVDLAEHRAWNERVCSELGIEAVFPLWKSNPEELMLEFVNEGFEAYVIATTLGEEWLGRKVDTAFINDVRNLDIHPCGESGEYHTFVTNGPLFKRAVEITCTKQIERDGTWFLEIERDRR